MQTFRGIEYLKIDIANSFGLDKKDWSERLQWYQDNEHQLMNLLKDAENSAQFYAGAKAMQLVKMGQRNSGYTVGLDATSSGIQLLSVLTGDRKAAQVSNVVDTGHRRDAYTDLYEVMKRKVAEMSATSSKFERGDLKQAIMTSYYGSKAVPKKVFGEGTLLQAFYRTLEEETPFAWALNQAFLKMWDPNALSYEWVLPDNFHVKIKVMDKVQEIVNFLGGVYPTERSVNKPMDSGRSLGANMTHSVDGFVVRELVRRCDFDPAKKARVQQLINDGPQWMKVEDEQKSVMVHTLWEHYEKSGYLSARILDYLDESNFHLVSTDPLQDLLDSMPERPFKVITVHDRFAVHPNYGNDIRRQYNLQLSLIARSDLLSYLLSQLHRRHFPIKKKADLTEEALRANYALS